MRYTLALLFIIQSIGWAETAQVWKTKREDLVTVSGTLLHTDKLPETDGKEVGAKIRLKTETGVLNVHVGPMWFSTVKNAAPQIGDPITVVGIRMSLDKKSDLIAREVQINGKTFTVWEKAGRRLGSQPTNEDK